ncbi:MAG TPA: FecR domain-containing protein [Steroidobacteraceae bacterium]|nr:FecR domain-containing protein [Steroidobacteraceae bacterium]
MSLLLSLSLAAILWIATPIAHALDIGDIIVANIKGDVTFTLNGAQRALKGGAVLTLPAVVHTGKDGSVELKQGATSIRVGPDTELNFPASEKHGGAIDRIVQPRGNAFYDIGKRDGRKLRVETPVLVGVVKGTQFNVTVLEGTSTFSLFEGRLEIVDVQGGGAVDLNAGEVVSRKRGDNSTSVLKMSSKPSGAVPKPSSRVHTAESQLAIASEREAHPAAENDVSSSLVAADLALSNNTSVPATPSVPEPGTSTPEIPTDTSQPDMGTGTPGDAVTPPDAGPGDIPVETPGAPIPPVDTGSGPGSDPSPGSDPGAGPDLGNDQGNDVDLGTDDGNNGHGNDDDHDDSSNPGRGHGRNSGRDK